MHFETPPTSRTQMVSRLAQVFSAEYTVMLAAYTPHEQLELTEHLLYMLDVLALYRTAMHNEQEQDAARHYHDYAEKDDQLLHKYGSRFRAYQNTRFYEYFSTEIILSLRDIVSDDVFNNMPEEQQGLSVGEVSSFVWLCRNGLNWHRRELLLSDAHKETTPMEQGVAEEPEGTEQTGLPLTRGRQLLMIYYLLRSLGVEVRRTTSISDVTRLVHAITGIRFTALQNSEVYKKLSELSSDHKTHKKEDLFLIRNYFDKAGLQQVVALIDEELEQNYRKTQ